MPDPEVSQSEPLARISDQIDVVISLLAQRSAAAGEGSSDLTGGGSIVSQETSKSASSPRRIVEDTSPVGIMTIAPAALMGLSEAIKSDDDKGMGLIKKEKGFIESLLNTIGAPLLALAGGITGLLAATNIDFGAFDSITNVIGKYGLMGGLKMFMKPFIGFFTKGVLKGIPIIGALVSFYFAYEDFKSGSKLKMVTGALHVASGILNLIGPLTGGIGSILGIGLDILNAYIGTTYDKPGGYDELKADALDLWQEFGAPIWKHVEPYIRYVPILGSIWLGMDAYEQFKKGDLASIGMGILYATRAIVNLDPSGAGPLLSYGIGVIQGFLDPTLRNKDPVIGASVSLLEVVGDFIGPWIRDVPVVGSLWHAWDAWNYFDNGDWGKGLLSTAQAILQLDPLIGSGISLGLNVIRGLVDPAYRKKSVLAKGAFSIADALGNVFDDAVNGWYDGLGEGAFKDIVGKSLNFMGFETKAKYNKNKKKSTHDRESIGDLNLKKLEEMQNAGREELTDEEHEMVKREIGNRATADATHSARIARRTKNAKSMKWKNAAEEQAYIHSLTGRAVGGGIQGGTTYLTGENGPELVQTSSSGTVHSTDDIVNLLKEQVSNGSASIEILKDLSESILAAIKESGVIVNNNTGLNVNASNSDTSTQSFRDQARNSIFR